MLFVYHVLITLTDLEFKIHKANRQIPTIGLQSSARYYARANLSKQSGRDSSQQQNASDVRLPVSRTRTSPPPMTLASCQYFLSLPPRVGIGYLLYDLENHKDTDYYPQQHHHNAAQTELGHSRRGSHVSNYAKNPLRAQLGKHRDEYFNGISSFFRGIIRSSTTLVLVLGMMSEKLSVSVVRNTSKRFCERNL